MASQVLDAGQDMGQAMQNRMLLYFLAIRSERGACRVEEKLQVEPGRIAAVSNGKLYVGWLPPRGSATRY